MIYYGKTLFSSGPKLTAVHMQAQVKRAQEAVRAERARQKIAAGQKVLAKL